MDPQRHEVLLNECVVEDGVVVRGSGVWSRGQSRCCGRYLGRGCRRWVFVMWMSVVCGIGLNC